MTNIPPVYGTPEPNKDIVLHQGSVRLQYEHGEATHEGTISLCWLPRVRIRFHIPDVGSFEEASKLNVAAEALLTTDEIPTPARFFVTSMSSGSHQPTSVAGVLADPLETASRKSVSYVVFHLPNFTEFPGRTVLEAQGVRTVIEPVNDSAALVKQLKAVGGYAITHVGRLEATNGKLLPVRKVERSLLALFHFLSFLCGARVQPILPVGYDAKGNAVWRRWANWQLDSWQSSDSPWCDAIRGTRIDAVFEGFMARYTTAVWHKPVRDAIHWYVVSHRRRELYLEDAVVLTQAALEMLAWTVLAEDPDTKHFTRQQLDNINAAQRLRCLLNWAGIPRAIPADAKELASAGESFVSRKWEDGAEACTTLRNSIVHATPAKIEKMSKTPSKALFEATSLALWYLELVLLRLFNYSGVYVNRLKRGVWQYEAIQPVPWAAQDGSPGE